MMYKLNDVCALIWKYILFSNFKLGGAFWNSRITKCLNARSRYELCINMYMTLELYMIIYLRTAMQPHPGGGGEAKRTSLSWRATGVKTHSATFLVMVVVIVIVLTSRTAHTAWIFRPLRWWAPNYRPMLIWFGRSAWPYQRCPKQSLVEGLWACSGPFSMSLTIR